jgi:hypothetical protein
LVLHIFTESDGSPEERHHEVLEESKSRDGSPEALQHKVVVEESKSNKVEPVSEGEIFCFVSQKNESRREMFMIFDFVIRYYLKSLWCNCSLKKIFLKLIQFFLS